jgi:hypothetical protein
LADGTTVPVLDVTSTGVDVPMAAPRTSTLLDPAKDGPMTVGTVKKAVRVRLAEVCLHRLLSMLTRRVLSQHMIKQLILLTQNLADLPRAFAKAGPFRPVCLIDGSSLVPGKRCLSFKTFYEEHTPEECVDLGGYRHRILQPTHSAGLTHSATSRRCFERPTSRRSASTLRLGRATRRQSSRRASAAVC